MLLQLDLAHVDAFLVSAVARGLLGLEKQCAKVSLFFFQGGNLVIARHGESSKFGYHLQQGVGRWTGLKVS